MLKKLFCAFTSISLLSFCVTPLANAASTGVMHFNPRTHQWDAQVIPNIEGLRQFRLISAGQYAWAVSNTAIAFYNGTTWGTGTGIPGMENIKGFYPGFPLTGKYPVAWAIGVNSRGTSVVAYFDGTTWSQAQHFGIDLGEFEFAASNGHAWAMGKNENGSYYWTHTSMANPNAWPNPQRASFDMRKLRSYNDDATSLFVFSMRELTRIDANNHITSKSFGDYLLWDAITKNNFVVLSASNNNGDAIIYSKDNGNTWTTVPSIINQVSYQFHIDNGLICGELSSTLGQYACLDTNVENPQWERFEAPVQNAGVVTDANGAWLVSARGMDGDNPHIYYYNLKTHSLKDTHVDALIKRLGWVSPVMRVINNQFVSRAIDKNGQVIGIYYDGKQWITIPFPNFSSNNAISLAGDTSYQNYIYATSSDDAWVYPV